MLRKIQALAFALFIAENITLDRLLPVLQQKLLESLFFFKGFYFRMPEMYVKILAPGGFHSHMRKPGIQYKYIPRLKGNRPSVLLQIHDALLNEINYVFVRLSSPVHVRRFNHHRIRQPDRWQNPGIHPVKHSLLSPFLSPLRAYRRPARNRKSNT